MMYLLFLLKKTEGVPALLVYKGGTLIGNYIRLKEEFGSDFYHGDVENYLIEWVLQFLCISMSHVSLDSTYYYILHPTTQLYVFIYDLMMLWLWLHHIMNWIIMNFFNKEWYTRGQKQHPITHEMNGIEYFKETFPLLPNAQSLI